MFVAEVRGFGGFKMIVNAKEMLKIQKQMEQKEKNRPIHSDYCLECGCPKEICCERRGRVEELKYLVSLVHSDCTDCLATKKFLEERIKELEEAKE